MAQVEDDLVIARDAFRAKRTATVDALNARFRAAYNAAIAAGEIGVNVKTVTVVISHDPDLLLPAAERVKAVTTLVTRVPEGLSVSELS